MGVVYPHLAVCPSEPLLRRGPNPPLKTEGLKREREGRGRERVRGREGEGEREGGRERGWLVRERGWLERGWERERGW